MASFNIFLRLELEIILVMLVFSHSFTGNIFLNSQNFTCIF